MSELDLSKPVKTKSGQEVVIHTTEGRNEKYPVIGEALDGEYWQEHSWGKAGNWRQGESEHDLVNVTEKHTVWVAFARRESGGFYAWVYGTNKEAVELGHVFASKEVSFREGEGLE